MVGVFVVGVFVVVGGVILVGVFVVGVFRVVILDLPLDLPLLPIFKMCPHIFF